ncbi:hypothetical protein CTEN210_13477 [Chaetoceros tenuissimus]|uniref:Ankyrin repeat protein n=1 Tax=Chaetoceros tenuissimus TaxID=426638 RepID=A0AAD3HB95_9STRA|nr:hypothetical protein CTEN210_13477 [Chaetoceros tenuissimus]
MDDHRNPNEAPARKKARVEVEDCTTRRTDALTRKIQNLAKEFPEMKYVLDLSDLRNIIEPIVTKYKDEVDADKNRQRHEANSPIYMLPDEMIAKCFSYVKGSYLLVAPNNNYLRDLSDRNPSLCYVALWFGHLETLKWLRSKGFDASQLNRTNAYMTRAVLSKNIDFISYCKEEGYYFNRDHSHDIAAIQTDDIDIFKFCFENGCEFSSDALSVAAARNLLDVCKYLRSKAVQWAPDAMDYVVQSKSLEILKFAHENGCVWTQETWKYCVLYGNNWDIMNYLHLVDFIISKKLPWEEELLLQCIRYKLKKATRALVENSPRESLPKSLSYIAGVLDTSFDFDIMKSLHSMGIPFGEGLLKKFCGYTSPEKLVEISKWALQNSYEIEEDEIYKVFCQTWFDIGILRLLYTNSELRLDMVVKRLFRDKHYKKGFFRSEQFQLFLDLSCTLTKSLTKTILKCWLSNQGNDVLQDIVDILLYSEHLSIDDIYMNIEESDDDESDDDDVIIMD